LRSSSRIPAHIQHLIRKRKWTWCRVQSCFMYAHFQLSWRQGGVRLPEVPSFVHFVVQIFFFVRSYFLSFLTPSVRRCYNIN
jgi:hypothetical protein